ncbi:MAG TPA: DNA-3-methyladenine glycosylase [Hyphomicrobiales bacterium]|nr:DNA-3-methyladenine glycosylase [Hyphomicrobiales bacterium]
MTKNAPLSRNAVIPDAAPAAAAIRDPGPGSARTPAPGTRRRGRADGNDGAAPLAAAFFARPVLEVAPELIGATLLYGGVGGTIVEVEAYGPDDPAAHGFRGLNARNGSLFGPPGRAYVYRSYGIHWCLNFVCATEGVSSGVLIRAVEPTAGLAAMAARRGLAEPRLLCSGPGRVCAALGVTKADDGRPLDAPPFAILPRPAPVAIVTGPRIGISRAADWPWRFGLAGSRFVSKPFPRAGAARP